jgi:hypothetical protein
MLKINHTQAINGSAPLRNYSQINQNYQENLKGILIQPK